MEPARSAGNSLAPAQEGQWETMTAMCPGDPGRSLDVLWDTRLIDGPLNLVAMRGAFEDVARRHEGLRLRFRSLDLIPTVSIDERPSVHLELLDLTAVDPHRRGAAIDELVYQDSRRYFDLLRGPLWHAWLVRLDRNRHLLNVSFSHIIADGWACNVFVRDLLAAYRARMIAIDPFPEPAPSFAQLHGMQLERLAVTTQKSRYWQDALRPPGGRPWPAAPIGTDPNPQHRLLFAFPSQLPREIGRLAWVARTTPFVVCMCAYYLLRTFSSQERRLVIGTASHGRRGLERDAVFQSVVDPYVSIDTSRQDSVVDALRIVHESLAGAIDNLVPYTALGRAVNPAFDRQRPWPDALLCDGHFLSSSPDPFHSTAAGHLPREVRGGHVDLGTRAGGSAPRADRDVVVTQVFMPGRPRWRRQPDAAAREVGAPRGGAAAVPNRAPGIELFENRLGGSVRYDEGLGSADDMRAFALDYTRLLRALVAQPDLPLSGLESAHLAAVS